mgnify:CR=1 FL=1
MVETVTSRKFSLLKIGSAAGGHAPAAEGVNSALLNESADCDSSCLAKRK